MAWRDIDWTKVPRDLKGRLETKKQEAVFDLLVSGIGPTEIARRTMVSFRNTQAIICRIQAQIEAEGHDQRNNMLLVSPSSQSIKGRSALVKVAEDGSETVAMYWNKTSAAERAGEDIVSAIRAAAEQSFAPRPPIKSPAANSPDLCTVYTITDFHLGMYAWADETGASWDMKIAREVLLNAIADMISASPDSHTAIFAQLGDLLHWDGLLALTPTAKNVLDADTRFPLLVQSAIDVCISAVEMLLEKHKTVHVLMAEGNHDMASSVWMRAIMAQVFGKNKRVTVDVSPFPFYSYIWGKTFLGWHHGHLQKMDNLPLLFATDPKFKSDYGQCLYTYIHTGHQHHQRLIEKGGIVVEQHDTLAARDAHGAREFLASNRGTKAITYHKQRGEVSRCTVRPDIARRHD